MTLSLRTQELISEGFKICGKSIEAYHYIEERLYVDEANEVYNFIEWLIKIDRPYGSANAQQRWKEFKQGDKPPKEYYDLVKEGSYTMPGSTYPQKIRNTKRMVKPTIDHAALIMYGINRDLNWNLTVVNQDKEEVNTFDTEKVFAKVDQLQKEFDKMSMEQKRAFHEKRKVYGYIY